MKCTPSLVISSSQPLPPINPQKLCLENGVSISPHDAHVIATKITLQIISSVQSFIQLIPQGTNKSRHRAPIWFRGGYRNWNDTLHAILYFYHVMTEDERSAEMSKSATVTSSQIKRYNANIKYLQNNRIDIHGKSNEDISKEVQDIPCNRTLGFGATYIDAIGGKPCNVCGFELCNEIKSDERYKKKRKSHPSSVCLNCKCGIINQVEKRYERNNHLTCTFIDQVINNPKPLAPEDITTMKVDLSTFLKDEFDGVTSEASEALLRMLGVSTLNIKVVTLPDHLSEDQYRIEEDLIKGAECKVECLFTHPNLITDDDEVYDQS